MGGGKKSSCGEHIKCTLSKVIYVSTRYNIF
jgi:hypothetical protein